jgi:hypothetical protein
MLHARLCLVMAMLASIGPATAVESVDVGDEWRSLVEPLLPIGAEMVPQLADPQDARSRYELYRLIYTEIAAGYVGLFFANPEHPEFWPQFSPIFNPVFPNPDQIYYVSPVADDGVYRISGYRGTVRIASLQATAGDLTPKGTGRFGATTGLYDFDDLKIAPDGSFEVILSPARPADYQGDWWQLHPETTAVILRQIANDWLHEEDGRYAIERLDRPATRPQPSVAELQSGLQQVAVWARNWTQFSLDWTTRIRASGAVNAMRVPEYTGQMTGQRYSEGAYELKNDEALILDVKLPGKCRYWGIQLADEFLRTVYWSDRQNHLNAHTARIDGDGRFRAVISANDPGVPNWLDTAGYPRGLIYIRYQECDAAPNPTVRLVKAPQVREYLPADTPVVSATERDAAMRLRKRGAQMRRKW